MTELFDYSCSHPSFHLERFVVLQSEYHSESNIINLPSLLYFSAVRFILLDVTVVPVSLSETWEPSRSPLRTPLLSHRWPLGGARPQGWAASSRLLLSSVSIWSCLFCKHLQWLNLLLSVLHESLSSFLFPAKCLSALWHKGLARRCSCQKKYKKTFWWTHLLHFLCRFTTKSLFSGKYV